MPQVPVPMESVDRALRALKRIGESGLDGIALGRLAKDLSIHKASLHRTLSALLYRGYVEQNSKGNYCLGSSVLTLADSFLREVSLKNHIHNALIDLCLRTNETCHLGVLVGEDVMFIDKVQPPQPIRTLSEIGWRNPALTTALGRSIASQTFIDYASFSQKFRAPIPPRTSQTQTALKAIWEDLVTARRVGYAVEIGQNNENLACIAKAVMRGTRPIASISVTVPSARMNKTMENFIVGMLCERVESKLPKGLSLQKAISGQSTRHLSV